MDVKTKEERDAARRGYRAFNPQVEGSIPSRIAIEPMRGLLAIAIPFGLGCVLLLELLIGGLIEEWWRGRKDKDSRR